MNTIVKGTFFNFAVFICESKSVHCPGDKICLNDLLIVVSMTSLSELLLEIFSLTSAEWMSAQTWVAKSDATFLCTNDSYNFFRIGSSWSRETLLFHDTLSIKLESEFHNRAPFSNLLLLSRILSLGTTVFWKVTTCESISPSRISSLSSSVTFKDILSTLRCCCTTDFLVTFSAASPRCDLGVWSMLMNSVNLLSRWWSGL